MPSSFTKKRARDENLLAQWDQRQEEHFARFHLTREQIKAAQLSLQGYIVLPGDPQYDQDRKLSNPVFNAFPSMIIYCVVESDVAIALQLAQHTTLPFTVRSGGHCTAGFSAGNGVLIDVSKLNDVYIDTEHQFASVGCGCPFSKLSDAMQRYGLHVPIGECEDVCVGGFVQGGGYGFTSVTYGMNCDNVIDVRVMLASGRVVTASRDFNRDLWWAVRGGTGGNFGVLLSVRYKLRPLGKVFGWAIIWALETEQDMENATGALLELQDNYMLRNSSRQMNVQISLCFQPGVEGGLPVENMKPYLLVRGLYVGTDIAGLEAIAPLQKLPGAITQWTMYTDFNELNEKLLNVPYSLPSFPPDVSFPFEDKASRYVARDLTAQEWRSVLDYFKRTPNQYSYAYLEVYGGAINDYPYEDSAFIHRRAAFDVVLDVFWWTDDEKTVAQEFLDGWIALWEPISNGHIYQNYPRLDQDDYGWRYWGDVQNALYAVKCKYDPGNAFRFAQCIKPALKEEGQAPLPATLQAALKQPIEV